MADLIGPFDSAPWSQTEWYTVAPAWAPSGIIGSPAASVSAGDFAVTASGLNVTVACAGDRAWIDGSGYKPDTDKTLPVTANANASLSRRDRIVVRRDLAAKTTAVVRLTGTPASGTPAAPDLTQITGGIFEVPICSFLVPPNNGTTLTGFIDERVWTSPSGLAVANAAARSALNPASSEYVRSRVTEIDTGRVVQSNGSKWVKVGGPPELIAESISAGGSPAGNGAGYVLSASISVPAHTAGTLRCRAVGAWTSPVNAAAFSKLQFPPGTDVSGSTSRGHNNSAAGAPTPIHCDGYITSDGTARTLGLYISADAGGGGVTPIATTFQAWLV